MRRYSLQSVVVEEVVVEVGGGGKRGRLAQAVPKPEAAR